MANFSADPRPHLPAGFVLCTSPRVEQLHQPRVFLGLSTDKAFENVAIAHFFPRVSKDDFNPMAHALRLHMLTEHNVGTLEVQPLLLSTPLLRADGFWMAPLCILMDTQSDLLSMMKGKMLTSLTWTERFG
jgi:hypothetical protein